MTPMILFQLQLMRLSVCLTVSLQLLLLGCLSVVTQQQYRQKKLKWEAKARLLNSGGAAERVVVQQLPVGDSSHADLQPHS